MITSNLIAGAAVGIAAPIVTYLVKTWLGRSKNRSVRVELPSGEHLDFDVDRKLSLADVEKLLRNDRRLNEKAGKGRPSPQ